MPHLPSRMSAIRFGGARRGAPARSPKCSEPRARVSKSNLDEPLSLSSAPLVDGLRRLRPREITLDARPTEPETTKYVLLVPLSRADQGTRLCGEVRAVDDLRNPFSKWVAMHALRRLLRLRRYKICTA